MNQNFRYSRAYKLYVYCVVQHLRSAEDEHKAAVTVDFFTCHRQFKTHLQTAIWKLCNLFSDIREIGKSYKWIVFVSVRFRTNEIII